MVVQVMSYGYKGKSYGHRCSLSECLEDGACVGHKERRRGGEMERTNRRPCA